MSLRKKVRNVVINEQLLYQLNEDRTRLNNSLVKERQAREELLGALKNLLYNEIMPYYHLFPNSHRMSKEDYFSKEIYLIDKHTEKDKEK